MTLYNLPNATNGADSFITQTIAEIPSLVPSLLLFVWFSVFLGGILKQKTRSFNVDYSLWSVIASLGTLMIAFILSTVTGTIRLDILIIVLVITIFSGVWFFLDRKASEV